MNQEVRTFIVAMLFIIVPIVLFALAVKALS